MSSEGVHTAFDAVERELGCEFMEWEGWLWPNHFGDAGGEHHAVRQGEAGAAPYHTERQFGAQIGVVRYEMRARRVGAEQPVAQVRAVAAQILTGDHRRTSSSSR